MEDLNMRDIINMEDLTDRADELSSSQNDDGVIENEDAAAEYEALAKLIAELEGLGGDHQWHGDWYPGYLIRDSYFESYMDEMLEDCGDLPKDLPCYLTITIDYAALQQDYSSVEVGGVTYWCR